MKKFKSVLLALLSVACVSTAAVGCGVDKHGTSSSTKNSINFFTSNFESQNSNDIGDSSSIEESLSSIENSSSSEDSSFDSSNEEEISSKGLGYTLNESGDSYAVIDIGFCVDTDVIIPASYDGLPVTVIGNGAFFNCFDLTSVVIGDNVTKIGFDAFYNCRSLASVEISDGVTEIGKNAFRGCRNLTNIKVSEDNCAYKDIDGNLCTKDGTVLIQYTVGKTATEFVSPDSITTIGDYAFSDCDNLTSVTVGESVTTIGGGAFLGCSSLRKIELPSSAILIGGEAFYNTGYYNDASNWGNDVLYIGKYLIAAKTSIKGEYTIKEGTLGIAYGAFLGCNNLASIEIPDSVIAIGDYAFCRCALLTSIKVNENNSVYKDIDGNLYTKDGTVLMQYAIGKTATEFVIPDSVVKIGCFAFIVCQNLTSITIPDNVIAIDEGAFYECENLASVLIPDSVTTIGERAFEVCSRLTNVVIGEGVTIMDTFAFSWCKGLTSITFEGTVEEWNAISKGSNWKYNVPATEVVCKDGSVAL